MEATILGFDHHYSEEDDIIMTRLAALAASKVLSYGKIVWMIALVYELPKLGKQVKEGVILHHYKSRDYELANAYSSMIDSLKFLNKKKYKSAPELVMYKKVSEQKKAFEDLFMIEHEGVLQVLKLENLVQYLGNVLTNEPHEDPNDDKVSTDAIALASCLNSNRLLFLSKVEEFCINASSEKSFKNSKSGIIMDLFTIPKLEVLEPEQFNYVRTALQGGFTPVESALAALQQEITLGEYNLHTMFDKMSKVHDDLHEQLMNLQDLIKNNLFVQQYKSLHPEAKLYTLQFGITTKGTVINWIFDKLKLISPDILPFAYSYINKEIKGDEPVSFLSYKTV